MNNVFIPQEPSKFDKESGIWIPTVNLKGAAEFGKIIVLLPPNISPVSLSPIRHAVMEKMECAMPDDYLVAVGDPTLIALCACILSKKFGKLNMLKWDRVSSSYISIEVKV